MIKNKKNLMHRLHSSTADYFFQQMANVRILCQLIILPIPEPL